MKKVLLIAFDFPPRRTSGIYRPTGMCKYLSQFGWEPTVLTVGSRPGELEDPLLLERLPKGVRVFRTPYLNVARWEERTANVVRSAGGLKAEGQSKSTSKFDHWIRKSAAFVRSCVYFPDEFVGWVPFGFYRALRLVMEEHFDLIYTTSPPRPAPVIGLLLKALTGMRWVAEFRDPWYPPPRPIRRATERWLQLMMLRRAEKILVVAKGYAAELRAAYGIDPVKIAVVSNGFDEEDFVSVEADSPPLLSKDFVNLTHLGTVYADCVGNFFDAVEQLMTQYPEMQNKVRINFIGFPDQSILRHASGGAARTLIRIIPFLGHANAIRAMHESDGLLLFYGRASFSRLYVAGKMYEYLRSGRPILAVTRGGETEEMIREGNAGWAVHPEHTEGIKQALVRLLRLGGSDEPVPTPRRDYVDQFCYERLAEKLARVFDSAVSHES